MTSDAGAADNAASTAAYVFGHPVRALIFRFVSTHPDVVFGQIYDYVHPNFEAEQGKHLTRPTLTKHLHVLEDGGVLLTDLPSELRRGRSPKYSVDAARAKELVDAFVTSLRFDQS